MYKIHRHTMLLQRQVDLIEFHIPNTPAAVRINIDVVLILMIKFVTFTVSKIAFFALICAYGECNVSIVCLAQLNNLYQSCSLFYFHIILYISHNILSSPNFQLIKSNCSIEIPARIVNLVYENNVVLGTYRTKFYEI